jgi:hypothetical protein
VVPKVSQGAQIMEKKDLDYVVAAQDTLRLRLRALRRSNGTKFRRSSCDMPSIAVEEPSRSRPTVHVVP